MTSPEVRTAASSKTSLDSDRASFSPACGGEEGWGAVHRTIKKINCVHPFNFQIFQNGELTGYIDGSDVKLTSWMRFIRSARHKKEQNLFAFQYLGRIFYRAFKDILPGEEMLVWYDEKYPQYLGIPWTIFDLAAAVPPGRWSQGYHSSLFFVLSNLKRDSIQFTFFSKSEFYPHCMNSSLRQPPLPFLGQFKRTMNRIPCWVSQVFFLACGRMLLKRQQDEVTSGEALETAHDKSLAPRT